MHRKKKILIAGGGIGGLVAALAFEARGCEVVVCERTTAAPLDRSAGIQLSPNAMKVLRALGLGSKAVKRGFLPQSLEMRLGRSGRRIFKIPLGASAEARWGAPYLHIHRGELIDLLTDNLQADLRLGAEVQKYQNTDNNINVTLADGSTLEGNLLVGADGIHSAVRAQMLGEDKPHFTNTLAWRATVPTAELGDLAPPPTACVWVGAGRHAVTYLLRGGKLANFVGVVESKKAPPESWVTEGTRADVLEDFDGWHPTLTTLIARAEQHFQWALYDRAPLPRWHDGRAVLLGDAAHPALPFMAQGAAMALEDAAVLARLVDTEESLAAFYAARIKRTAAIQRGSRARMKTYHRRHALADAPLWVVGKFAPNLLLKAQDWLYKYQP